MLLMCCCGGLRQVLLVDLEPCTLQRPLEGQLVAVGQGALGAEQGHLVVVFFHLFLMFCVVFVMEVLLFVILKDLSFCN